MPLTRDFRETVMARIKSDPAFRGELIVEANIMHSVNVAYGPFPVDGENEESFISRWTGLVAKAAIGELTRPGGMPIRDFG